MPLKLESDAAGIVLLGSFNPAIFQPTWFALEKLLRREEADAAKIEVIHSDVTSFSMDWLRLLVTHERFSVETAQATSFGVMRDLVVATFTTLQHTPVTAVGINRHSHFKCESDEAWHAIGDKLAPKEAWNRVFPTHVGMRRLQMQIEPAGDAGKRLFMIEPSLEHSPGVFMAVNEQFDYPKDDNDPGASRALSVLKNRWPTSMSESQAAMTRLLEEL